MSLPCSRALAAAALVLLALAGCGESTTREAGGPTSPAASPSGQPSAQPLTTAPPTMEPAAPTVVDVSVQRGQVVGSPGRVEVGLGAQVVLRVASDVEDEVHVHGYDLTAQVGPAAPGRVTFTADIPGVFEVELHDSGLPLLSLQVS